MRFSFKQSLFGYNRKQVELRIEELEKQLKQQQEDYEGRIKQVVAENVNLSVDLNVARSGYKDSAELMLSAQSRVRDLEKYLESERQRVARLEQQQIRFKQGKAAEPAMEEVKSLQERIASLEALQKILTQAEKQNDGTLYDALAYDFPEGIQSTEEDEDGARGLMQRLYRYRAKQESR